MGLVLLNAELENTAHPLIMHPLSPTSLLHLLSATPCAQQAGGASALQSGGQEPKYGGLATSGGRTTGRPEACDSLPRVASLASWGGAGVL